MTSPTMTPMDDAAQAAQKARRDKLVAGIQKSLSQKSGSPGGVVSPAKLGETIQAPQVPSQGTTIPSGPAKQPMVPIDWTANVAGGKASGRY